MRVIIFANGEFSPSQEIVEGEVLIAADGGARHMRRLGLTPRMVIGDFDSLPPDERAALEQTNAEMIPHPARKDETDLELALVQARAFHPDEIVIYGALGARWDMTIANVLLLAHPALREQNVRLCDAGQELRLLHGGQGLTIAGTPGDRLSLIPLRGEAHGINTQGLEYALEDEQLGFGSPRGVSNVLQAAQAHITLRRGMLLIVHLKSSRKEQIP